MTKKAKKPTTGNRYTGSNMTAREAQTIDGCIRKMNNILIAMKDRGVYIRTTDELNKAIQHAVNAVIQGNRMEEISPSSIRES